LETLNKVYKDGSDDTYLLRVVPKIAISQRFGIQEAVERTPLPQLNWLGDDRS
jgi:hypothetical protein